jgi:hypothetical protein
LAVAWTWPTGWQIPCFGLGRTCCFDLWQQMMIFLHSSCVYYRLILSALRPTAVYYTWPAIFRRFASITSICLAFTFVAWLHFPSSSQSASEYDLEIPPVHRCTFSLLQISLFVSLDTSRVHAVTLLWVGCLTFFRLCRACTIFSNYTLRECLLLWVSSSSSFDEPLAGDKYVRWLRKVHAMFWFYLMALSQEWLLSRK